MTLKVSRVFRMLKLDAIRKKKKKMKQHLHVQHVYCLHYDFVPDMFRPTHLSVGFMV